ncbi:hypothetical protein MSG28_011533 [Choristoneura fumiferana]|uniref:Uncharacterized protein n=1 Tax=Choristoneura fumiferana TaxID=7141 RepID=A0ACC0JNQ2_CHOFU|nr:hypothetical protein MSG28_011533 [Choristoneura fumiferana]
MYVCKNQLGIEKEYEQRTLPDGRLSVDGFVCVYDVSLVPGRSWDKQNETLAALLQNIIKLKKPVVLVTSKNDEACEQGVREAERLVQRKEFKGCIPIVESSSHDNVANYAEALRIRRETLDFVTEAFTQLIRIHVVFRRHVRRLKEEKSAKKLRKQLANGARCAESGSGSGSDSPLTHADTLPVGERATRYQVVDVDGRVSVPGGPAGRALGPHR